MDFKRLLRTPSTTPFRLQVDDEENARNTAANEVTGEAPGLREVGRNDPKPRDMKAKSFRHDAKIWHVYLEDAEKEAREQAELWRTGLESLLIFAGLFAAIVASFLIDSKKDLQLDSEQKLLNDIRAATLRQGNSYHAPTYTDTVNGLWAISLYLTLFSAIMGVLAKAWIAKYIPATSRHEASDAASRFMLDQQARNWYIQEVITLIPLLVQIATFLFLVGLFLQIFDDNKKLGYTLMIFCISGGVMYLVITGTHLFARTAPMNTPLSELLLVKINRKASDAGYFPIPTDGDKEAVLAHILYTRLIQSPKHSSLDAAVEEIKPGLIPEKWVQALCRGTTPGILAARLQQCITTVSQDKENRHSNILNQLTVFLWFAEIYDRELSKSSALQYSNLDNTFRDLLKTGKPLHRLNGVDVAHRPLLFTLTANVLAILPLSRQETPKEHDLRVHELLDRPWETALRKIESAHRAGFMLAACRGLVSGKRVLKITSAFILSQSFAKAASYMMESGAGAEWDRLEHEHQRKSTELLALQYLREVHLVERNLLFTSVELLQNSFSVWNVPQSLAIELLGDHGGVEQVLSALSLPHLANASQSHIETVLADINTLNTSALLTDVVERGSIFPLAECVVVNSTNPRLCTLGLDILRKIAVEIGNSDETVRADVTSCLAVSLHAGLAKPRTRASTIKLLEELQSAGKDDPLYATITMVLHNLMDVGLDAGSSERVEWQTSPIFLIHSITAIDGEAVRRATLDVLQARVGRGELRNILNTLTSIINDEKCLPLSVAHAWTSGVDFIIDATNHLLCDILLSSFSSSLPEQNLPLLFLKLLVSDGRFLRKLMCSAIDDFLIGHSPPDLPDVMASDIVGTTIRLLNFRATCPQLPSQPVFILRELLITSFNKSADALFRRLCSRYLVGILEDAEFEIHSHHAETIKTTILETLSVDTISDEIIESLHVAGAAAKAADFAEMIPLMLNSLSWSEDVVPVLIDFFLHSRVAQCERYSLAFHVAIPTDLSLVFPNENMKMRWWCNARWIRLLTALALKGQSKFRLTARNALGAVLQDVKGQLADIKAAVLENVVQTDGKLPQASQSGDLSDLIVFWKTLNERERIYWIETFSVLTTCFAEELPGAAEEVTLLCWGFERTQISTAVCNACFDQLLALLSDSGLKALHPMTSPTGIMRQIVLQEVLKFGWQKVKTRQPWRRPRLISLFEDRAGFEKSGYAWTDVVTRLANISLDDDEADSRLAACVSLNHLIITKEQSESGLVGATDIILLDNLRERIMDNDVRIRLIWVNYICYQAKNARKLGIARVLRNLYHFLCEMAIDDVDSSVRAEALESGFTVVDTKGQRMDWELALILTEHIFQAFSYPGRSPNAVLTLISITSHKAWSPSSTSYVAIKLFAFLGPSAPHPLHELVARWVARVISGLGLERSIQHRGLHFELCRTALCHRFSLVLEREYTVEASMAMELFRDMMDSPGYEHLVGYATGNTREEDETLIRRLAEICISNDSPDLRKLSMSALKAAFKHSGWRDMVKRCLSQQIEGSIAGPLVTDAYINAVSAVFDLVGSPCPDLYKDIVSPVIFQLMTLAVTDEDHPIEGVIKHIFVEKLAKSTFSPELNRDVWRAILATIGNATRGRAMVEEMVETLPVSSETATWVAKVLAIKLSRAPSYPRSIIIKILSILHSRHGSTNEKLLSSAVSDLINVALDEKESDKTRREAMRLLIKHTIGLKSNAETLVHDPSKEFTQVNGSAAAFMPLLDNNELRACAVEIISLMCSNHQVRVLLLRPIIALAVEAGSPLKIGIVELIVRIISGGYLGQEPIDFVLLLLAPVLATRTEFSPYQFEILRSLKKPQGPSFSDPATKERVTGWFTFALFGRHAREHEVTTWLTKCEQWLPRSAT